MKKSVMTFCKGFTLIELLIVMLIISIVSCVAVLTINTNHHKQFAIAADQIANLISFSEDEAMLRSETLGFSITSHAIQFYVYKHDYESDENPWRLIATPPLNTHQFSENILITLKNVTEKNTESGAPSVIISQNGELTPFRIFIGNKHEPPYSQVEGLPNGQINHGILHADKN